MNNKKLYSTPDSFSCWDDIDFNSAEKVVKKLQKRIREAFTSRRHDVMMYLQYLLIHSYSARALAVKTVSSNDGRYTAGVDGMIWDTPDKKFNAINSLKLRGYEPKPLKRIYIPKGNGSLRPLSIPTVKDRAMQTLFKFALEPISEITADSNSYAYLHNRSAKDAIRYMIKVLSYEDRYCWILKTDIKSCFDNLSQEWIMNNIPLDKKILRKTFHEGYIDNNIFYRLDKGVPQGGCLSGIFCNMSLDGLEGVLNERYGNSIEFIRYADDIIVFGKSPSFLVQSVLPTIKSFLRLRNLNLSAEKTSIKRVDEGFSFLGYTIQNIDNRLVVVPSRKKIDNLLLKIKEVLCREEILSYKELCDFTNKKVRGWLNYYKDIVEEQSLYGVEFEIVSLIYELVGNTGIADCITSLFDEIN